MKTFNRLILILLVTTLNCSSCLAQTNSEVKKLSDDERMAWWRDSKFGMFIHWGVYSIPGGERDGKICGGGAEWIMDKLDYTIEEYEKFPAMFNPVKFNADEWVSMAKDAGMKYIVITSKHHDGFSLWDSKVSDYDIMDSSPFKRDVIKELSEACKKQGIIFCFYHSIVDWHHPQAQGNLFPNYNAGQKDQTVVNPEFPKYYENYLKPQVKELLTNYGDIGVVWFDGDWIADYTTEMGKEFYDFIREIQPNTIINNRVDKGRKGMEGMDAEGNFAGDFGTPEQEIPATGIDSDWESCMTMNGSWGYKPSDKKWKSSKRLTQNLIDIVSKGGNFLLNIGPDGLGQFPPESVERLKAMGVWTRENGESIYGASASPYDKPEWGRYTAKDGFIYAHVFDWPEDGKLVINRTIKPRQATLLSDPYTKLKTKLIDGNLTIHLPEKAPNNIATVIKIKLMPNDDWANLKRYKKANIKLKASSTKNKNRVVFMGNSITEKWVKYSPEFFKKNPFVGRGISGQTTSQMLLRFKPDVIDLNPKAVVIHAGTNDIAGNRGPITIEQIAANIFSMAELAKTHNIKVVLASVLPASNYSWSPSVEPIEKIEALNSLIKTYAEKNNIVYLDYYSSMVDAHKGLKKEYGRDTVHPNAKGYEVMEPLVKEAIKKALKK
ncbi:alpha-L-fucosidase [Flavivirga aquimarina]|uniref:alpha-L-fucosidase n=1 Tax=Flavivirga aquimarina TaxID=2027862 RepID=A0ABT8WFD9_9FLAO|nr:alpha-L-fucosidase [Flavivirga aquimarina]MDO5971768.1 alpha-L-fucosidase [Flavivirga aquimarina]